MQPPTVSAVWPTSAEHAFALLTDVARHTAWVPLTRVDAPDHPLAPGDTFVAVSGPTARSGGPGLPDRMRLDRLEPPDTATRTTGRARYTKLGPVLTGWAEVTVRPLGAGHAEVRWRERIGVRGLPGALTDALGHLPTRAMLATVLRRARAGL